MVGPARARVRGARAVLALFAALVGVASLATACSACGKNGSGGGNVAAGTSSAPAVSRTSFPPEAGPAAVRDVAMWTSARDGQPEDLASLATHEGAIGLVEAAADPDLRKTALRAMGFARGWAQLPYLVRTAAEADEEEARLALDSAVELAARRRTGEDVEDVAELREGCEKLGALARDGERPRDRRVVALRVLRMMPCPKQELPSDLDAR
jgi:hypothetical protein